jgi:hypothetical protein
MIYLIKQFGLTMIALALIFLSMSIDNFTAQLHANTSKVAAMSACQVQLADLTPGWKK